MDVLRKPKNCKISKRRGASRTKKTKTAKTMTITKMLKNMSQQQKENSNLPAGQVSCSPLKMKSDNDEEPSKENCFSMMASTNDAVDLYPSSIKMEIPSTFNGVDLESIGPMRSAKAKKKEPSAARSQSITNFFQARRSGRKCHKQVIEEKYNETIRKIINDEESDIKVKQFPNKGRGVVTTRPFARNEFVVEYAGDLIEIEEAKKREEKYSADSKVGCYMYYCQDRGKNFCIDATAESGRLGRLLNHSRTDPNCYTKVMWFRNELRFPKEFKEKPHLTIVARRDIGVGEELTYDYGDRTKASLIAHPWLKD